MGHDTLRRSILAFLLACGGVAVRATAATDAAPTVAGRVVDAAGRPAAGAVVRYAVGWQRSATRADANGGFSMPVSPEKVCCALASTADGLQQSFEYVDGSDKGRDHPLLLTLRPARPIPVRVVDGDGRPVAGAWVGSAVGEMAVEATTDASGSATVLVPAGENGGAQVVAEKPGVGLDYAYLHGEPTAPVRLTLDGAAPITARAVDVHGQPMAGVALEPRGLGRKGRTHDVDLIDYAEHFRATSGTDGTAKFNWCPRDLSRPVEFRAVRPGHCELGWSGYGPGDAGRPPVVTMAPLVHVAGRVVERDGRPMAGARVRVAGEGLDGGDDFRATVRSDVTGDFAVDANPAAYDVFVADMDHQVSPVVARVLRDVSPDKPVELKLQPATRVHGRLTGGATNVALPNVPVMLDYVDRRYADLPAAEQLRTAARPRQPRPRFSSWVMTGPDGEYEFWAGEERFSLRAQVPGVRQSPTATVSIDETADVAVDLHSDDMPTLEIEPKTLHGRVVDHGVAVVGATIDMDGPQPRATSDASGGFACYGGAEDLHIRARSPDGTRVGLGVVHPGDASAMVGLDGAATASGRLLGPDGQPLAGARMLCGLQIETRSNGRMRVTRSILPELVVAGDDGRFMLRGLIAGQAYMLTVLPGDNGGPGGTVGTAHADTSGQALDLGDLRLRPQPARRAPAQRNRPAR